MMLPLQIRRVGLGRPWDAIHDDFDRMLSRCWTDAAEAAEGVYGAYPVDVHEDEDHVYLEAELPGFAKNQIDVAFENGVLTISAEREPAEAKGETHLNERRYTKYVRRFSLPNTVSESDVDASLTDGVLHLTLNKPEKIKPRKIEVK